MKRIIFISSLILITVSLHSQKMVNIKLQNERIAVAMKLITQQTGVEFSYNPKVVDTHKKISVSIVNKEVTEAVYILLHDKYFFYIIKDKYVIITSAKTTPKGIANYEPITEESKKNIDKSSGNNLHSGLSSIGNNKIADERIDKGLPLTINNKTNETIMLKKIAGIITLSALTWGGVAAQVKEPKTKKTRANKVEYNIGLEKSATQFTFITPMSTDGSRAKDKEYKFSLNVLGGITGGINGVELGGLFNINKRDMRGLQMSGLFNLTEGVASGFQFAGIANIVQKSSGFQYSGVANYTAGINDVQISGVVNIATASRFQMAGVVNYAQDVDVQIAPVNIAKHATFQMGVINIAETDEAAMLGILNYVRKGGLLEIGISANDYIYGAVNLVTGTDRLYSILSFGGYSPSSNVTVGWGLGTRIQLRDSPQGIHFELMHNQIYKNNFKNKGRNASLEQAKVLYSVRKNKFTFYGGPTINGLIRDVAFTEVKDPVYSIFNKRGSKHNFDLWAGAEIGVRFNFK